MKIPLVGKKRCIPFGEIEGKTRQNLQLRVEILGTYQKKEEILYSQAVITLTFEDFSTLLGNYISKERFVSSSCLTFRRLETVKKNADTEFDSKQIPGFNYLFDLFREHLYFHWPSKLSPVSE